MESTSFHPQPATRADAFTIGALRPTQFNLFVVMEALASCLASAAPLAAGGALGWALRSTRLFSAADGEVSAWKVSGRGAVGGAGHQVTSPVMHDRQCAPFLPRRPPSSL